MSLLVIVSFVGKSYWWNDQYTLGNWPGVRRIWCRKLCPMQHQISQVCQKNFHCSAQLCFLNKHASLKATLVLKLCQPSDFVSCIVVCLISLLFYQFLDMIRFKFDIINWLLPIFFWKERNLVGMLNLLCLWTEATKTAL